MLGRGNPVQATVANARLGHHRIAESLDLRRRSLEQYRLQAVVMVQMHVQRGDGQVMVGVMRLGEPLAELPLVVVVEVGEHAEAVDLWIPVELFARQRGANQVAHRLRPVTGALALHVGVELLRQLRLELAKFRAARRLWAKLIRERYAGSDSAARLRFHTQTGGVTLTAQQPLNNVVRVTVQALAAVLGGTQSLHTNAYDEALALPTPDSARLALRTQQLVAHESGAAATVDPLAGSYFVESLTDSLEAAARSYIEQVNEQGGAARAIPFLQDEIHRAAYEHQKAVESGDRVIVGVNAHREADGGVRIEQPDYAALERAQRQRLANVKGRRDEQRAGDALDGVRLAARGSDNLLPYMVEAVKALATLGEISDVLRQEWGEYRRA